MIRLVQILFYGLMFCTSLRGQDSQHFKLKYQSKIIANDSAYAKSLSTKKAKFYHDSTILYLNQGEVYYNYFGHDTLEFYASDTLDVLIQVDRALGFVGTSPLERKKIKEQLESRTDTTYPSDSIYVINGLRCLRYYFPEKYISYEVFVAKDYHTTVQTNVLLLMGRLSWDRALTFKDLLIVKFISHNNLFSTELYLDSLVTSSIPIPHPLLPKFHETKKNKRNNRRFEPIKRYEIVE